MSSSVACLVIVTVTMMSLDRTQGESLTTLPLCQDQTSTDPGVAYDPARQVCCNGVVHEETASIHGQICCGKQLFNNLSHMCCGQESIPLYGRQQCCGGSIAFDSEMQMCCGNNVYDKSDDFNMCCGNYPMNALEDTCCHAIGSSGMISMPTKGRGQCCGLDFTYDPEVQICCQSPTQDGISSEVVSRNDNVACCGGRSYNTFHQVCCGTHLFNKTSGRTECCGMTTYNPDIEHCCAGTVFQIGHGKCCGDQAYHPSSMSCCQGVLHDGIPEVAGVQGCCGPLSYLETESMCCDGELYGKAAGLACCGKDSFNSKTHLCCAGNVQPKLGPDDACCGTASYDSSIETCCTGTGGMDSQIFPLAGGRCCQTEGGGMIAYDLSKATCCSGNKNEVFYPDVPGNSSVCCGHYLLEEDTHLCDTQAEHPIRKSSPADDQVCINRNSRRRSRTYNSRTQVCLRGTIRSKNRASHLNGCGPHILDPNTEICCLGRIHPNKDRHGNLRFCCHHSIHSYVPQHQSCCSGRVDDIPDQDSKCCRNRAYNKATHTCDRNGIVRQTSEMALFPLLCGSKPYHPSEHECCGEVLIGPGQTCCRGAVYETGASLLGEGRCCDGVKGYNPRLDICCGGVVHENIKKGTVCCGSQSWDPNDANSICCDGMLQSSSGGSRKSCRGWTAYNSLTETVCAGVVHPQPNGICCGKLVYDSRREICCGGNIYPKETSHTMCCGAVPYNSADSHQRCCDGSLHSDASSSRCCGDQLFDPNSQHCCFHTMQNATYILNASPDRNCNSLHSQGGTMSILCDGKMHAALANGECCGDAYIQDTQTHMCCHGNILEKLFGANSVCCDSTVVDSAVTRC